MSGKRYSESGRRDPNRRAPRWAWAAAALGLVLLAGGFVASRRISESIDRPRAGSASPRSARCGADVHDGQQRGMCYAHNWQHGGSRGYGSEVSRASLRELAELGIDWISVTPFGYQPSLESTEVRRVLWPASETDERLRQTVEEAHALGLAVMMKPHLWINYHDWRGQIRPTGPDGWDRWFDSYERFILHYAGLSQRVGADMFVVGVELASSSTRLPERWRGLIARIREVYDGPLVYAANWDEAESVTFWDALDYIGIQMFAPLAVGLDDSPTQVRARAREYLERYRALSERYDRPVILTEVGYKSVAGSLVSPWAWPEHLSPEATVIDEEVQADAYCVMLEVFGEAEFIAGIYWWKWFTDPDTDEEGPRGFSPRGKLAEDVLREAYGGAR